MPSTVKMISSRWELSDGHTIARYRQTGGYEALRKALTQLIKMREKVLKIIFGDEEAAGGDHV